MPLGTPVPLGPARLWHHRPADADARPAVLLVHGGYHGAWCWDYWASRLAEQGREVAALDWRGHGGLPQPPDYLQAGAREFTQDVVAAMAAIDRPSILVGHSLGGLLVPLASIERKAAALVLVCPSPPGNMPGAAKVPLVPTTEAAPPLSAEVTRQRYCQHLTDAELSDLVGKLCAESPTILNDRYGLRVPVDPAAVTAPVLVIEGGRDDPERHPPGQDKAIADFYGGAHLRLDDAPHDLMLGAGSDRWFDAIWTRVDALPGIG